MARNGIGIGLATCLACFAPAACASGPKCNGPSQAVTPVRDVRAPYVRLAGVRLDFNSEQARAACEAAQGTFRDGAYCRPILASDALRDNLPISPSGVDVKFDRFGRAKEITAFYTVDDESLPRLIQSVVSQIASVVGDVASGDLSWCNTAEACARARYAEWQFEGGVVRLEGERRDSSLELRLIHSHRDMTEQVTYGLPVCSP